MRRFPAASILAALFTALVISFLSGCSGTSSNPNSVTQIILTPATVSLNQGQVTTVSAVAENYAGTVVAADINFSSSNTALAQISSGGLVCAGAWDANIITCTPKVGAFRCGDSHYYRKRGHQQRHHCDPYPLCP